MLSPSNFRKIVSGQRKDFVGRLLRCLFRIIEIPYGLVVRHRNRAYDAGRKTIHRVEVPVVCVGNLTLGGTGKTPMVQWLAGWLNSRGLRPVIVSRGYGNRDGQPNDEAMELQRRLPGIPHIQNPDRAAAAKRAIDEHAAGCIVLDDGFQHRRLARDLDMVLLDATEPFGFEHLFPRGTLREPLAGLQRAHIAILSRAELMTDAERQEVQQRVKTFNPQIKWAEVTHQPMLLINCDGQQQAFESLSGKRIGAFCAIGNPTGFWHTLKTCGLAPVATREFADHHQYTQKDFESLDSWVEQHQLDAVVCTFKDLVKLESESLKTIPVWAVSIEIEFLKGKEVIEETLAELIKS